MFYLSGKLSDLVDLETMQRLGSPCVAAWNAYQMCVDLPDVAFMAMDARHCAGTDMAELMAYGASVGSASKIKGGGDRLCWLCNRCDRPLFRSGCRDGHNASCADWLCE